MKHEAVVCSGLGESFPAGLTPAHYIVRLFLCLYETLGCVKMTVKSPVAKKDVLAITPFSRQNLIEVSGNFYRLSGEMTVKGVESIRHAHLGCIGILDTCWREVSPAHP